MDIARTPVNRTRRRLLIGGAAIAFVTVATVGLASLKPAAPTIERGSAWIDTVQRGPLLIHVRGPGTLVPEQTRWVTAVTAGRVERRLVEPGQAVKPETVILVLSNPDVQLEALESERQLAQVQSEAVNQRVGLMTQRLTQEGVVAGVEAEAQEARRQATAAESLVSKELISEFEAARLRERSKELTTRLGVEKQRLALYSSVIDSQITMQQAQVARLRAVHQFQRDRVRSMEVTAGATGVVQELPLEVGQWAQSGATLARVVEPGRLKAVLRIPETQAKDVAVGLRAQIDTRNGIVQGRVVRIDPASVGGTVTVDVALEGALPRGARPDLSVDGTIEIDRLDNTLFVGRPAYGEAGGTVGLFRLTPDGTHAERVQVRLGRSSVNAVEITAGLAEGDRVIISDMSRHEGAARVKLD
jgi:multidrug efflux pump subunit AcrA (membrane-fusion protein)